MLQSNIEAALCSRSLQPVSSLTTKVIQLYETMLVHQGVLLVGPTRGGKTTAYRALADALRTLHETEGCEVNLLYKPIETDVLNPQSVSMDELYGEDDPLTREWSTIKPSLGSDIADTHKWVVSDVPVDVPVD
ncbi:dynein axonemal heavy chain 6-like [Ictalurus furcatus]|uniref:dynein axonemal heavy chain 6-like n=1 Tax=Ictalurus furcatus TaxID=66913 RepID=UPI0023507C92|nr:dynein axonemal heavy chain 6-like [Ictalurus furcatus]